jgi:hypothetical protein
LGVEGEGIKARLRQYNEFTENFENVVSDLRSNV